MKSILERLLSNDDTCINDEVRAALQNIAGCHSAYFNHKTRFLEEKFDDEEYANVVDNLISLACSFFAMGILYFAHGITYPNEFQTPRN